ncbi:sugar ABC transporter substrate-binding protein [Actinomycetes bacterium M1A6_2h]
MTLHKNRRALSAAIGLALTATVVAGCSSTGGAQDTGGGSGGNAGTADTPRVTIAMVTHEAPGDTFWDLIRKGAEAAAAKDNIDLKYSNDNQAPRQATLVQSAIDSKVAGIAVTMTSPDAIAPEVRTATDAGIPVTVFNAGKDQALEAGAISYFGQDETIAGQGAGARLNTEGAKKAICVVQEQGSVSLEARCAGAKQGFTGGSMENLNVNGTDLPSVQATISAKLQSDPSIDTVLTLGAPIALTAVQAIQSNNSSAKVVTFDTNAALVDAIKGGDVQWAIDQQPYLQGYLAVDQLWLYLNNKNIIGGGQPVLTGPSFIDKSNIDAIAELAQGGTR